MFQHLPSSCPNGGGFRDEAASRRAFPDKKPWKPGKRFSLDLLKGKPTVLWISEISNRLGKSLLGDSDFSVMCATDDEFINLDVLAKGRDFDAALLQKIGEVLQDGGVEVRRGKSPDGIAFVETNDISIGLVGKNIFAFGNRIRSWSPFKRGPDRSEAIWYRPGFIMGAKERGKSEATFTGVNGNDFLLTSVTDYTDTPIADDIRKPHFRQEVISAMEENARKNVSSTGLIPYISSADVTVDGNKVTVSVKAPLAAAGSLADPLK